MKTSLSRLVGLVGLVGLGLVVGACGGGQDPAPFSTEGASTDLSQTLAEKTGATLLTLRDDQGHAYGYIATDTGRALTSGSASEADLRAFLGTLGDDLGLGTQATSAKSLGAMQGAGGAGGSAVRLRKVVPGTDVPLLDESVSVALRDDGSFAFLSTGATQVAAFDVTPVLDAEAAKEKALARAGQDATVPEAPVLGVSTTEDAPRLVYRVDIADAEGSLRVDVDAKTGNIANEGRTDLHALAYSAESYLPAQDKGRAVSNATLECGIKNGKLARETRGGRVELFDYASGGAITAITDSVETLAIADTTIPKGAPANFALGVAVNAQFHIGNAADFFATSLVGTFGRSDGRIPVYVHSSRLANGAQYVPSSNVIEIGDGARDNGTTLYSDYSAALAYDMMAHETAHGLLYNRGLTVALPSSPNYIESRALHEGLADVFAMAAESAGGGSVIRLEPKWSAELLSFGAKARLTNAAPYRNHLHPKEADSDHYTTGHRTTAEPTTAPYDLTTRKAYFRSGLVSHAFALMAYGGVNETSHIGVDTPLGMNLAYYSFAVGSMFLGKNASIQNLAHATVGALAVQSYRTNAACAWVAVGVLSKDDALGSYGASCHNFSESPCSGMKDGTYCSATDTFSSYTCKNGQISGGEQCLKTQYCQRTGGSYASPAKLDAQGHITCGTSRDPLPGDL